MSTETPTFDPWHPMTNPPEVKTLAKLGEESGELASASMRCLMQGIDERHPETGYPNRMWLEDELADVRANGQIAIERFKLDEARITSRATKKLALLRAWHDAA